MRLATFNVNSIRQRAAHVRRFLERQRPDLLFLQETRCRAEEVPALEFEGLGYRVHAVGQPGGRNGVAVVARVPFEVVAEALPGEAEDSHARYIEVEAAEGIRAAGIYLPNGNSGGAEGFAYKLRWMDRLIDIAQERLDAFLPLAILGDFNVCPREEDLAPRALPPTDALVHPESRARFRALLHLGLTDALRAMHPQERVYTYWDYGPAFEQNRGLRIDHVLLSPDLAERLAGCEVDIAPRAEPQPSDHTPVVVDLGRDIAAAS
jgi:exodeoxyribonuclease III